MQPNDRGKDSKMNRLPKWSKSLIARLIRYTCRKIIEKQSGKKIDWPAPPKNDISLTQILLERLSK